MDCPALAYTAEVLLFRYANPIFQPSVAPLASCKGYEREVAKAATEEHKKKPVDKVVNSLFEKRPKQFGIGGALPLMPPTIDLNSGI
ncbi:uncharacterized protein [Aegilops tauschii subsp. strangulata]|uniref:uncharacterized protein n=1 Tax=Aegilops tauschii subsp. strangulata TaxID=200361 RepID=UPI000989E789|nr:uncharacterized protein LOC109741973 [Aegilops tauschii subsp. strangulata]